jgi:hypothetical protein
MGIDFSGEIGESRLFIGLCHAFGMQGSLVQIQSSRPSIFLENQGVAVEHCTLIFSFSKISRDFPVTFSKPFIT